MFGFFKKKPAKPAVSEFGQIADSAISDVKAKWKNFHVTMHFSDDESLFRKIDFFSQPIVEFFHEKYPTLLAPDVFWRTLFTAILESGTHPKEDVNAAIEQLRQKYSPSAKKPDQFSIALQNFIHVAQDCAQEYFSNADYIEQELPNVEMTENLHQMTLRVCSSLKATRDEIFAEFQSWKGGSFSRHDFVQRAMSTKDLLAKDLSDLHVLAMSLKALVEVDNRKFGLASLLIGESATNMFQEFTRAADAAKELDDASRRV